MSRQTGRPWPAEQYEAERMDVKLPNGVGEGRLLEVRKGGSFARDVDGDSLRLADKRTF
jgi:hypothetical protein